MFKSRMVRSRSRFSRQGFTRATAWDRTVVTKSGGAMNMLNGTTDTWTVRDPSAAEEWGSGCSEGARKLTDERRFRPGPIKGPGCPSRPSGTPFPVRPPALTNCMAARLASNMTLFLFAGWDGSLALGDDIDLEAGQMHQRELPDAVLLAVPLAIMTIAV